MGIRDQRCVDSITTALLSANCFDIFEKKYKNRNEFRSELKKKLLKGDGREILKTFEGADILRKVIKDKNLDKTINIDKGNYNMKNTFSSLNKYIQNADKEELLDFCTDLCEEANSRAFCYKRA